MYARGTKTAVAVIKTETRASEYATATARASATIFAGTATAQFVAPTQTVVALNTQNAVERANWERQLIAAGTIGVFVLEFVVCVVALVVIGWLVIRFVNMRIARAGRTHDPVRGTQYLLPANWSGTQTYTVTPSMSPEPVVATEYVDGKFQVVAGASNPQFAARQAEVQMIAAASQGSRADDLLDKVVQRGEGVARIEPGDARAQSFLPPKAKTALDGEWKVLNAGGENE